MVERKDREEKKEKNLKITFSYLLCFFALLLWISRRYCSKVYCPKVENKNVERWDSPEWKEKMFPYGIEYADSVFLSSSQQEFEKNLITKALVEKASNLQHLHLVVSLVCERDRKKCQKLRELLSDGNKIREVKEKLRWVHRPSLILRKLNYEQYFENEPDLSSWTAEDKDKNFQREIIIEQIGSYLFNKSIKRNKFFLTILTIEKNLGFRSTQEIINEYIYRNKDSQLRHFAGGENSIYWSAVNSKKLCLFLDKLSILFIISSCEVAYLELALSEFLQGDMFYNIGLEQQIVVLSKIHYIIQERRRLGAKAVVEMIIRKKFGTEISI